MNASASSKQKIRLTKRGRVVFGTFALLVALSALGIIAVFSGSQALADTAAELSVQSSAEFTYVAVQPGDTLWQIAERLDPSVDPRDLVAEIVRLNQLEGSGLQVGQELALPLRYKN